MSQGNEEGQLQQPLLSQENTNEQESVPVIVPISEHEASEQQQQSTPAKWYLMSSYSLAAWAWRSWEFAVALLLMTLHPESLLLVSIYGLVDNGVRVVFGSQVGAYIAKRDLLPASTTMYLFQNACIGISAACAMVLLMGGQQGMQPEVYWTLTSLMIGLGALSSVGSSGVRISVEVEAVTALAGSSRQTLSTLNAGFRAIDLTCLLAAPMLVGAVFTWLGPAASTMLLAGYTMLAWIPETVLLRKAVNVSPVLKTFKLKEDAPDNKEGGPQGAINASKPGPFHNIGVYLSAPTFLPGLALACLYCTVLSLGFLMTGYLNWTGLTGAEVSVYRGLGAVTGLAATALYPAMNRKLGTVTTGLLGIGFQLTCLCVGTLPVILAGIGATELQPTQGLVRGLVAGVVASRTGLWIFDLAVTQLVQERVDKKQIGIVSGLQSSLSACFETLSFLAGIYFADPELFYWLMLGSLGLVSTAFTFYAMFAIKQSCFPGRTGSTGAQAV